MELIVLGSHQPVEARFRNHHLRLDLPAHRRRLIVNDVAEGVALAESDQAAVPRFHHRRERFRGG